MNETTKRDAVNFTCEQCGREGGKAIFTCPERPSGRCPFVEQWRQRKPNLAVLSMGLVLAFLAVLFFMRDRPIPFVLLVILAAAGLFFGGIFVRPEKVQLYNVNSGVRLQRTTLWGRELRYKWVTSGKPVPIDLELSQPLAYPPSITALIGLHTTYGAQAVAIIRTALIGLLAKGHIQVCHFRSYASIRGGVLKPVQDVYSIVATQEFDQARFKGGLERKIGQILANWSRQKEIEESDGPPLYDLVRAIYGRDRADPGKWLVQLVAKDVAAQGLGQMVGTLVKRFEWDAAHANQLQQEQEIMKALSKRLAQLYPDFSLELDKQIRKGIKSMKSESG